MTMSLSLLRVRLSVGRSCATGIAKAVRASTNTSNAAVNNLRNVQRFSAGAGIGNNNSSEKITKATSKGPRVLPACLLAATVGLGVGYVIKRHVDEKLGVESSGCALGHASSTLSDETKAELLRYVDGKFSEAQELTKSFQTEARADLLRDRRHAENAISAFEAEARGELARTRKQIAEWRAADERTLAEFKREVTEKVNSRAANRGISAECSVEFARIRQEIYDTDRRLSSVQSQVSSRAANEGKFAECSSDIARLRQEVGNTDRKLSSALFKMNSLAASAGSSAEASNEIARLRQEVGNIDRKLSSALFKINSRAANEGSSAEVSNEIASLRQEVQSTNRKVNRLQETVDRLVEDSRRPPSDPGVGSSGPKAKKYKQD